MQQVSVCCLARVFACWLLLQLSCVTQAVVCSTQAHHSGSSGSRPPFIWAQAQSQRASFYSKQCRLSKGSHRLRQIQTCCVAPNTQSFGRRVVGGVAGAAFLTWALQSASAKSMKPGEVEKRSREEENAVFENRQGEVTLSQPENAKLSALNCCQSILPAAGAPYRCRMEVHAKSWTVPSLEAIRHRTAIKQPLGPCK